MNRPGFSIDRLDDAPNPFQITIDDGPSRRERLWRTTRFFIIIAIATACIFGGIQWGQTWLVANLEHDIDGLPVTQQQERLVQLASFGVAGVPPLTRQLTSQHDAVSATAYAMLHGAQDEWLTWPNAQRDEAHRKLAVHLNLVVGNDVELPMRRGVADRIRELLRRTILQYAEDTAETGERSVLATAQAAMQRLYHRPVEPTGIVVSRARQDPPTIVRSGQRAVWTDWPPVAPPSREPVEKPRQLEVISPSETPTLVRVPVANEPADQTSLVNGQQQTVHIVRTSAVTPGSSLSAMKTESLLHHLSDPNTLIAGDAEAELIRRGLPRADITFAQRIGVAVPEDRIRLIDEYARGHAGNPIPWLKFLLSDSDRRVRLHVVSILGTMRTMDAGSILRSQLQQESDLHVATRIRRVLELR
ncbi:MAG: HEAT repeat domain-containing protein [Planctomycetota bacterium]